MYFSFDFYEFFTLSSKRKRCATPSVSHSLDSSLQEGALTRRPTQKPPSEREVASRMRCRKEFCSSSFFIYTIYPRLLAQKTQKVRVRALKKVVVTQTLPVRVPSWPICLAMT